MDAAKLKDLAASLRKVAMALPKPELAKQASPQPAALDPAKVLAFLKFFA